MVYITPPIFRSDGSSTEHARYCRATADGVGFHGGLRDLDGKDYVEIWDFLHRLGLGKHAKQQMLTLPHFVVPMDHYEKALEYGAIPTPREFPRWGAYLYSSALWGREMTASEIEAWEQRQAFREKTQTRRATERDLDQLHQRILAALPEGKDREAVAKAALPILGSWIYAAPEMRPACFERYATMLAVLLGVNPSERPWLMTAYRIFAGEE